jgi:hypothetical protein
MARQSSILSMSTEGLVSASSSSFFSLILLMLCPKSENWAADSSRRELLPENSVKSWYQYTWGVYGEKAFTSNIQRALQTSAGSSSCSELESKILMTCRLRQDFRRLEIISGEMTGNLNFLRIFQKRIKLKFIRQNRVKIWVSNYGQFLASSLWMCKIWLHRDVPPPTCLSLCVSMLSN